MKPSSRSLTVLTIAGSDPTGGAGIQADLRTLETLGLTGVSVVSAITAQDAGGVQDVFRVAPEAFASQLETLLRDRRIAGVKTGMLLTAENVRIAARLLKDFAPDILVVDPVMLSSNGISLLEKEAAAVMVEELFPLATVVTPNIDEALTLSGLEPFPGEDEGAWVARMCEAIKAVGPENVVVTGGHRSGEPADILYDGKEFSAFGSPRVPANLHGSGCVFSSALCGYLALGLAMAEAVSRAKKLVLQRFMERQEPPAPFSRP